MVLDDQKLFTDLIAPILVDLGVGAVKVFNEPKDALAALKSFTPNLIISDIEMGEQNGSQFIQEAREKYPAINLAATVFLTAHSESEMIQQAKGLRVAGYLLKPISQQKIQAILGKVYNSLLTSGRL